MHGETLLSTTNGQHQGATSFMHLSHMCLLLGFGAYSFWWLPVRGPVLAIFRVLTSECCTLQTGHCWLQTAQQYTAFAEPDDDAGSRDDPGYVQWYLDHGKAYQQADPGRVSHVFSLKLCFA